MTKDTIGGNPAVPLSFAAGETLGGVLGDLGLGSAEAHEVVTELAKFADLRKLRPQDQYSATFSPHVGLEQFDLLLASRGRARVQRGSGGWEGSWRPYEKTVRVSTVEGRVDRSLEVAIEAAGGPSALSILMSDVFQWDLDFTRDLRQGDTFNVLFETVFLDGAYESLGDILAITYDNQGRRLEAYRFGEEGQYFDPEGRPMRKMFLRSPLRYSRVTSRFSNRRFHPILKRYRPHHGVDYGAPTGTPARATANGTVSFAGWDGGGGKTVKVRHANGYVTAYLHLSRFGPGVRSGRRVNQGDVIGYVGSTGLATASHLDYRVQRSGRWIDPLSLRSVPADPVPSEKLPEFLAWRDRLRQSLFDGVPPPSEIDRVEAQLAARSRAASGAGVVGGAR
jgi:murein DD-endopeptidase MepM/ murein hydrolase activator NlpD